MSKYYVREDDAKRDKVVGPMVLTIRANTAAAQSDADEDFSPLITDTNGKLWVNVGTIGLPSGASTAANQATIIGHVDGIETLLTGIDADTNAINTDIAAIELLATAIDADTSAIKVAAEAIDDIVKAEDAAHSDGDKGVMALGVRDDIAATLAASDGDYASLSLDKYGRLRTGKKDAVDVWRFFHGGTGSLADTTMKAAATGMAACITDLKVSFLATVLIGKVVIEIDDGTTLIYSQTLTCPTNNLVANLDVHFDTPLFASEDTNLTIKATYTLPSGSAAHSITASGYSIPAA